MSSMTLDALNSVVLPAATYEQPANPHKMLEATLVERLKAGSQAAFRELIERYETRVFGVICGILGNREDADEVARRYSRKSISRYAHLTAAVLSTPGSIELRSTNVTDSCARGS